MTVELWLRDLATRDDLRIYLERLQRAALPEVRCVARGEVLAVFGCTQAPESLLDSLPVVLVLRSFRLAEPVADSLDRTVLARALLDRLARAEDAPRLALPDVETTAAWAGILPPTGGWRAVGTVSAESLAEVARGGIDRVASMLPEQPGEAVVRRVRTQVWGVEVAPGVPAAAAFALESMGFLRGEEQVRLANSRSWTRLTSSRGEVIVRHRLG